MSENEEALCQKRTIGILVGERGLNKLEMEGTVLTKMLGVEEYLGCSG